MSDIKELELPTEIELLEYFKDTHTHIINVQRFITGAIIDLQSRAFEHDISKYSAEELLIYAKVTPMF